VSGRGALIRTLHTGGVTTVFFLSRPPQNGFKCHISSEAHQRQLLLVAENPGRYVASFSQQFLRDFMKLLSHSYGTRRVHANEVYQEYIKDKNHYHMNATRWTTLTGFCMFLGKTGMVYTVYRAKLAIVYRACKTVHVHIQ
jgi:hypothetical protein